jgi:hypothetical protein
VTISDWTGVIGLVMAVLSFGYALWEKRSRTRLEDYIRAQNWSLYGKASNANGHTQMALSKYKALGKDALDPEVLEFLSKADAFGQDVFKDVIRQIKYSEPTFDDDTVTRWIREGRVEENHALLFRNLTPANKPIQATPRSGAPDG